MMEGGIKLLVTHSDGRMPPAISVTYSDGKGPRIDNVTHNTMNEKGFELLVRLTGMQRDLEISV